jgi:hypothetical protein
MLGFSTITSKCLVTVFVQGFQACSTIETMRISTLDSWHITQVSKPTWRTATVLKVPVVFLPKFLVIGNLKAFDSQIAFSLILAF